MYPLQFSRQIDKTWRKKKNVGFVAWADDLDLLPVLWVATGRQLQNQIRTACHWVSYTQHREGLNRENGKSDFYATAMLSLYSIEDRLWRIKSGAQTFYPHR